MQYNRKLPLLITRSLVESMDQDVMVVLADRVIQGYDIYIQTGYPENIPIPNQQVAETIVFDMIEQGFLLDFVGELMHLHESGWRGHEYPVMMLKEIVKEVIESGYIYNAAKARFIEDHRKQRSHGWGVLAEGREYTFSMVRVDMEGNSELVRRYSQEAIRSAYDELNRIFTSIVYKRNGRIWSWEGDGGLAAFYFSQNNPLTAVFSAMEFLHEMFLFNQMGNPLNDSLKMRIAVHSGPCIFSNNLRDILKCHPIKELAEQEKNKTQSNTVSISPVVQKMTGNMILKDFMRTSDGFYHYGRGGLA